MKPPKIVEYKVYGFSTVTELEGFANTIIEEGWQPTGGLCCLRTSEWIGPDVKTKVTYFYQAFVKYEENRAYVMFKGKSIEEEEKP